MDDYALEIKNKIENEPYAQIFKIKIIEIRKGYSRVSMKCTNDLNNFFSITQGGAIFSLVDFAFAAAVNSYEGMAVGINMNINYIRPALEGDTLTAEALELNRGNKTSVFVINVKNNKDELIATCQALAYIKKTSNK
jgi:acyl-CoA thioesterase